MKFLLFDYHCV